MTAVLSGIPGGYVFRNDTDEYLLNSMEFKSSLYKRFFATNVEAHFDQ